MPTPAELAALDYGGMSAFASGLTSTDYRDQIRQQAQGEACLFYKGIPVDNARANATAESNGRVYVEQTLDSAVRVYVYETRKEEQGGEFGVLPVGTTMLTCMPSEIWPVRGDRFVLTERLDRGRMLIERSALSLSDEIPYSPVVSVLEVRAGATLYTPFTDYTVSGQNIVWGAGLKPANGTKYSIEVSYRPTYEYYPLSERMPRLGADGAYLPLRGLLTRVPLTGE